MKAGKNMSGKIDKILGNIMIVEDIPENLFLLTSLLESHGHNIHTVKTGRDAIESVVALQPDLVLLDIMLPDINGFEVCTAIKANNITKDIPVIFLSALNEPEDKLKAFAAGGVDYIIKPYVLEEVRSRVQIQLEICHLRSLQEKNALELKLKNEQLQKEIEERRSDTIKLTDSLSILEGNKIAALNLMEDLKNEVNLRRENEDALRESEQRFRGFVENASDIVYTLNPEGVFTYVSPNKPHYQRDFVNEATGKSFESYIHPEDVPACRKFLENVLQKGDSLTSEDYRVMQLDGSSRWHSSKASVMRDKDGKINGMIGIARDITDRKQSEEALKESQERYRNFISQVSEGIYRFELDKPMPVKLPVEKQVDFLYNHMFIAECNDSFMKMYGIKDQKDIIGMSQKELHGGSDNPVNREAMRIFIKSGYRTENVITEEYDTDGSKKHFTNNAVGIIENGFFLRMWGTQTDISERVRAEETLRLSEEKFRNVFEHSLVGKSMTSLDGKMQINAAFRKITGYTEEELKNIHWKEITHPDDIGKNEDFVSEILSGKIASARWEKRYIHKNGNIVWVDISTTLLRNVEGNPLHFITSIIDITERKKADNNLKQSEEKFRKAFLTSPDSININRLKDGMYITVNKGFCQNMGYTEKEIIGKTSLEMNIWKNPEDRQKLVRGLKAKGFVENLDAEFCTKNGETIYGLMSASLIELEGELHILSITRDITERRHAQEEIRKIGRHYQSLIEKAPDGIVLLDAEGKFKSVSPSAKKIFGYGVSKRITVDAAVLTHPDDVKMVLTEMSKTIMDPSYIPTIQYRFAHKTGKWLWVESTISNLLAEPSVEAIVINFRDISDRKMAEEERKKAEDEIKLNSKRLKNLVDILQHQSDTIQGFLDYALQSAIQLTDSKIGYLYFYNEEKKEFELNSWSKEVMKECKVLEQKTIYQLEKTGLWGEAVRQRKAIMVNDFQSPNPDKKGYPDGHVHLKKFLTVPLFSGEKIVAVSGVANKESDYTESDAMQLNLLMDVVWKVVERKRAEIKINEQLEELRQWYEATLDREGKILELKDEVNELLAKTGGPLRYDNYNPEDTMIKDGKILHDRSGMRDISQRKIAQKAEKDEESETHRLLESADRSRRALLSVVEDQKRAKEEIQKLNETLENRVRERTSQFEASNSELEAFSYSVSHDLRAPLRHISGFISLFLENKSTELTEEELGYLDTVSNSANEMGKLIDALLSFSRLNRADLQKTLIDTPNIIKQGLQLYEQEIKRRKIDLKIGELHKTYGDLQLVRQVWTNLISNAVKYTSKKEKATIEIGSYIENDETVFFIKDNGAGFDMKYADKLFGVFQRLHKTRDFEGIGIGLANINRIITRQGGRCWAKGEIDKGATFYFSLPGNRSI
jgi:PAS domain S-box-containing protein